MLFPGLLEKMAATRLLLPYPELMLSSYPIYV